MNDYLEVTMKYTDIKELMTSYQKYFENKEEPTANARRNNEDRHTLSYLSITTS